MTNKLSAAIDSALRAFLAEVGRAVRESTPDLIIEAAIRKGLEAPKQAKPKTRRAPLSVHAAHDLAIYEFVKAHPGINFQETLRGTGLPHDIVRNRLHALRDRRRLRAVGRTMGCRYYVKR